MPADIILHDDDTEIVENVRLTRQAGSDATIVLDANGANIYLGGDGRDGDLVCRDNSGADRIHFDSQHGSPTNETVRAYLSGRDGNLLLGGSGADGDVILKDNDGNNTIRLDAGSGNVTLGGHDKDGDIVMKSNDGSERIHIDAQHYSPATDKVRVFISGNDGRVALGGDGRNGELTMTDRDDLRRIRILGDIEKGVASTDRIFAVGKEALLRLGGEGQGGQFSVVDAGGDVTFRVDGNGAVQCKAIDLEGVGDLTGKIEDLESGSSSDERLKSNLKPLKTDAKSLDRLSGVRYTWKTPGRGRPQGEQVGLVAQQVQAVLPEAVTKDSEGYLRVNFDSVVALLVERVKAQQQALDAQGTRVAMLEDRLARLEVQR